MELQLTKSFKKNIETLKNEGFVKFPNPNPKDDYGFKKVDTFPDEWDILAVWVMSGKQELIMEYNKNDGSTYYYTKNSDEKEIRRRIHAPKGNLVKEDVVEYLKYCFDYFNEGVEIAELFDEHTGVCVVDDEPLFEKANAYEGEYDNDFMGFVNWLIPDDVCSTAYYIDTDKKRLIFGYGDRFNDKMVELGYPSHVCEDCEDLVLVNEEYCNYI